MVVVIVVFTLLFVLCVGCAVLLTVVSLGNGVGSKVLAIVGFCFCFRFLFCF